MRSLRQAALPLAVSLSVFPAVAAATPNFVGDGRGIDAPRAVSRGEDVKVVAIGLKPGVYMVDLVRAFDARHLKCSSRIARARRAKGTVRFYGQIPTRFRCYSSVKKAFVSPIPVPPGRAKIWVHAPGYSARFSLRFQTTTVRAVPHFTG